MRFCLHYLNGNGQLPDEREMLEDTEQDIGKRFSLGWPKKKAHSVMGQFQREYLDDLANIANIPKVPDIYVKIYEDCGQRRSMDPIKYRDDIYRITEKGFERTSISSNETFKSN